MCEVFWSRRPAHTGEVGRGVSVCGKETQRWWGRRLEGRGKKKEKKGGFKGVGGLFPVLPALVGGRCGEPYGVGFEVGGGGCTGGGFRD